MRNQAPLAVAFLSSLGTLGAQEHHHHHHSHPPAGVLTIRDVLALEQNSRQPPGQMQTGNRAISETSGQGDLAFRVLATAAILPKKVKEPNPFDKRKRAILACAHGGFAYDDRKGKGQVYWFLQGAGILRIGTDRTEVDLLPTDPKMVRLNMHNATFFVHKGQGRIAWPANSGAAVFVTDVEGKLLHTIPRPTMKPYAKTASSKGANYAPTDTAYLDGLLWVTDGYASKFVMSYDLDGEQWTGTIFGGPTTKPEPGKFGVNHGITIHKGLLYVSGRYFARIHSYKPDTKFQAMFPLPDGSKPCDFEFFVLRDRLYGVAASLNKASDSKDKGASIYIVDMATLKIVSTIKPRDELGLAGFTHLHNVFPTLDKGVVTLFCQAWNGGDFAILRQAEPPRPAEKKESK